MLAMAALAGAVEAAPIPWKSPTYTLVARDMDLRAALDTFAVAEGLSVVMSKSVYGRFSGDFIDVAASEFLEKLATVHNLTWYYDGAALYVYGAGEIQTMLLDLQYMKAGELRTLLADLGVEDERFPLRTASNDELIMVSGPPRYVGIVAETIAKADKLRELRTFNEVEVKLFPLAHTWADDVSFSVSSPESTATIKGVARLLEEIMLSNSEQKAVDSGAAGDSAEQADPLERAMTQAFRPMIRPENRLNAVLVRDVKSRMPMYESLIQQLDVPQKLVEVAITVVELSRSDALDWQLSLQYGGGRGHSQGAAGQNAANIFDPAALAGQGLAGAITHIHSSWSLAASLTALKEKGKARSISRTSILTVNNLAAQITDTQSYHARVIGTEVASLEEVSAGTRINIKPRVIPSTVTNLPGRVWLTLQLDDGGFQSVVVDSMPMTRSSTVQTQTAVFEDQSIVLAGYMRDIEESGGWGIPYLRDIPWIGWIFGGASTHTETVQRLFIMTPRVLDLDDELLARLQAAHHRDITLEKSLAEDFFDSKDEAKIKEEVEKAKEAKEAEEAEKAKEAKEAEKADEKVEPVPAEPVLAEPVLAEPVSAEPAPVETPVEELSLAEIDERRNNRLEELVKELRELQNARKEAIAREAEPAEGTGDNKRFEDLVKELRELQKARKEAFAREAAEAAEAEAESDN